MHEISRPPRDGVFRIIDFLLSRRCNSFFLHVAFAAFVAFSFFQSLYHSFADFYYYRQRKHVPTVGDMKPVVLDLQRANPAKNILVVSATDYDQPWPPADAAFPLVCLYSSPAPSYAHDDYEAYQVYLLTPSR